MTTGERIKDRRKQLAINADTLAARVGVSRSTVFRWERGEIEKIPAVELNSIARALQTTAEYLIGFIDDPDQPAMINAQPERQIQNESRQTPTFRIISGGISALPSDEQEKILGVLRAMYADKPEIFANKKGDE